MKTRQDTQYLLKIHIVTFILATFFICNMSFSQCDANFAIEICDMENVDFDTDTTPDGIINLYTRTGITIEPGDSWESTGSESATSALDPTTGIVRLWRLRNASDQYFFTLRNASCPSGERAIVNLILGPYAGVPATTGFFPVCDDNDDCAPGIEVDLDLFDTLESREGEALPHLNGVWQYTGSLPSSQYILDGSNFGATIPDNGGFPIDSEDFTFTYTVGGIGTCVTESVNVQITIVRPVFAGYASEYNICDSDIDAVWDRIIDLRDDQYLSQEDDGGEWAVDGVQITSPTDSQINLKDAYDAFLASPEYAPGYGCTTFTYSYTVNSRSPICEDSQSTVVFRVFEELKPFAQNNPPEEICPATDGRSQLDLFDLLVFQPGFEYIDGLEDEDFVRWTLESRPVGSGDLSLQANIDDGLPTQKHRGTINLNEAIPGRYQFRYTVIPDTLCSSFGNEVIYGADFCNPTVRAFNPCSILSTPVILDILEFDYAGEDTSGINLCETEGGGQVSLRSLLQSNGSTIANGNWTDNNNAGAPINDLFDFPDAINPSQDFSFTHTTANSSGCPDTATLEFTVFKEPYAGENATLRICTNDIQVDLFDILGGIPDQTGTWFGPFGYVSTGHNAEFDSDNDMLPILGPGSYVYTVPGNAGCATSDQATVNVIIVDPVDIGEDINVSFCKRDGQVNLFSLLDRNTIRSGTFVDPLDTGALTVDGIVDFQNLENGDYVFEYVIGNLAPCDRSSLNINLQLIDLPIPNVPTQEFCILDAKRLEDIEVDVLNFNWYPTLESEEPIVDNPLLLDEQIYYIASVDVDNCESERLPVLITILNTGEKFSNGELCTLDFQDGVSPNGDNQNDTFDLLIDETYNIPEAFPDFDLKIYNRYGTLVYEGNRDTEEFNGKSNVSLRLGDDLPSGTYFYVFSPNFENNSPIQGSFYLSR